MEDSRKDAETENRIWDQEAEQERQEWKPKVTRGAWKPEERERQEWEPKEARGRWEPEYLPQEMLREAELENETLTIEDVRHELYVSETDLVAMRSRLKQREREYDKIRSSSRTSTVMAVICLLTLLFALSLQKAVGRAGETLASKESEEKSRSSGQTAETDLPIDQLLEKTLSSSRQSAETFGEEKILFAVVAIFGTALTVASAAGLCRFGYKAVRGHYRYFREGGSERAKLLSEQAGKPNLSEEIFQMQLQVMKKEERARRLERLRTLYRENLQQNIQQNLRDEKPQKSIYDE